jgi:predicted  nucleic acid-binding Zn-ribbon protein
LLPELKKLVDLQELDREILAITQELQQLPETLRAGEAALEQLQTGHAAHLKELENLKSQRRETEVEMADMEEAIKKSRQRLMEIKSNIEYKAMLKEIAFKEDQRDQKETRILELLEQLETQNKLIAGEDQQLKEMQASLAEQKVDLEAQMVKLKEQLAGLDERRRKLRKGVPPQLLKRYEFIRQRRNGTAISPVREGVCLGCNMNILPQQFIDLQKGVEVIQCPHCQRILYWVDEGELEAEEDRQQKVS